MNYNFYKTEFTKKALEQGYSAENIDKCLRYAEPLLQRGLPIIYNTTHFSALVGYNKTYINRATIYSSYFYRRFSIKKRNGGIRRIEEPLPSLKQIQRWILDNILEKVEISPFAKAYRRKGGLKENVRFHTNQESVLNIDIKDFFPSIHLRNVEHIFKNLGYSDLISNLLAKLCTRNTLLPQGAPTSPYLSNIFLKEFDNEISKYCIENKIKYTRYADDLTFSGSFNEGSLLNLVAEKTTLLGLDLNHTKTRISKKNSRQQVTGIVVNEKAQVPSFTRKKIRQDLYYIKQKGIVDHKKFRGIKKSNYLSHLLGKVNFVLTFSPDDNEFIEYKNILIDLKKKYPNL